MGKRSQEEPGESHAAPRRPPGEGGRRRANELPPSAGSYEWNTIQAYDKRR
ncbi:hypothetical protein EYF80_068209 [Liparis tanakae]|uniref:Uncharacterized protein n=1 Tax=Liparis tanakae TaxID=230148 RepID=A0A4Z2DZ07_9TELE|nr:hypothetical protein EYF80_068209 [Liparis tanakae]